MDRLSTFFSQFTLSARVFFAGQLCGTSSDHATETGGHLHVVRSGVLKILQPSGPPIVIAEPVALFYPRPEPHVFQAEAADIVCAYVAFGAGTLNPVASALPNLLIAPLASIPGLASVTDLLFSEAFGERPGRQAAVNRLAEYFVVLLLRFAIDSQLLRSGILSAFPTRVYPMRSTPSIGNLNGLGTSANSRISQACPAHALPRSSSL